MRSHIVWLVLSLALLALVLVLFLPSRLEHGRRNGAESGTSEPIHRTFIHTMSEPELDALLSRLHREVPSLEERLRLLAVARLGTPYSLGCLGEENEEDADPLFRVDSTDCTVFILTQAAMAHASSLKEARENMRSANYRRVGSERPVTFQNRLHFTYDRLGASPYFRDITKQVAGDLPLDEVRIVLNRKSDGTRFLPIDWEREVTVSFIPSERIAEEMLEQLPSVAGVALVKKKYFETGIVIGHEGMILDGRDFVHASSTTDKVVRVPFLEYLFPEGADEPLFDGVIFYEFR